MDMAVPWLLAAHGLGCGRRHVPAMMAFVIEKRSGIDRAEQPIQGVTAPSPGIVALFDLANSEHPIEYRGLSLPPTTGDGGPRRPRPRQRYSDRTVRPRRRLQSIAHCLGAGCHLHFGVTSSAKIMRCPFRVLRQIFAQPKGRPFGIPMPSTWCGIIPASGCTAGAGWSECRAHGDRFVA